MVPAANPAPQQPPQGFRTLTYRETTREILLGTDVGHIQVFPIGGVVEQHRAAEVQRFLAEAAAEAEALRLQELQEILGKAAGFAAKKQKGPAAKAYERARKIAHAAEAEEIAEQVKALGEPKAGSDSDSDTD